MLLALFSAGAWAQTEYHSYTNINHTYGSNSSLSTWNSDRYPERLLDNSLDTKYCVVFTQNTWAGYLSVNFESNDLIIPSKYVIYTGDDTQSNPGRNPKSWHIDAKVNSSDSWTTIHTVTNANLTTTNKTKVEYTLSGVNTAYKYFRFYINSVESGSTFQLQDFYFIATVQGGGVSAPTEIRTVDDWNDFCATVNSGHSYSGQTVTLMNDITTAVTTMAGTISGETVGNAFKGTFDGQGHTLTLGISGGASSGWSFTAPFRCIDGATIKNLKTTGTVTQTGGKGAAGIVGCSIGTCTITNCVSNVTINSQTNGDGTHGGFISYIKSGTTTFNGCAFTGSITGSNTYYCGGFVGWNAGSATFNNCVFAPTAITFDYTTGNSANFSRSGGNFNNCYYTQTCGTGWTQGKLMHSITGASGITVANAGTATSYTPETSTIVGYGTGIKFNNILYAGNGDNVSLTLGGSNNYMADHGTLTGSGSNYTLQMADYDTYIFVPITVSVSANPSNGGTVSGGGQYGNGASATVSAMTTGTYCFVNWTENGTVVSTDINYTFTVTGARTLVANFSTFDANNISVSGNTTIACGSTTTLTASGLNGVAYNWYSDAACTQLVQENSATLTTPALTENTTYYVKAVGGTSYMEQETTFSYTGSVQSYSVPSGTAAVKLEVWGAEGGGRRTSGNTNSGYGGKGGYSVGTFPSPSGTLYVCVGGSGSSSTSGTASGGYNGGGSGCASDSYEPGNGGGGATHIAKSSGLLTSFSSNYSTQLLIVAGGGGGGGEDDSDKGGAGGGTSGENGQNGGTSQSDCAGGGQTSAGPNAGFGYGASTGQGDGGGGGGGFYGGGSKTYTSSGSDTYGGGGGSGYLNTALAESQTIAGTSSMPNPNGGTMTGREGNGYARITAYVTEECESAAVEVTVTVTNTCPTPTNLQCTYYNRTSATLSWTAGGDETQWHVQYGPQGSSNPQILSTMENPYVLSLTEGYTYDIQVRAVCDDDHNVWSDWSNTITVTPQALTYLFTNNGGSGNGQWNTLDNWQYYVGSELYTATTLPTINDNVQINAACTIPRDCLAQANEITILNNEITGEAQGSITIEDGGQLQHNNDGVVVTVKRYIAPYGSNHVNTNLGYKIISFPVVNGINPGSGFIEGLLTPNNPYDFYTFRYNNLENVYLEWVHVRNEDLLDPHTGYLYASQNGTTISVKGEVAPSVNQEYHLDYEEGNAAPFNGWQLVGNPFVCNAYLTENDNLDFYVIQENDEYAEFYPITPSVEIPPMGGVMVWLHADDNLVYSRTAPSKGPGILNMDVNKASMRGTTMLDRARVRFGEGRNLEKLQLNPRHTKLYIPEGGNDYAVYYAEGAGTIPVNFKAQDNGRYTLDFSTEDVGFNYLHLIDNMNGNDVDLLQTPYYTFDAKSTDFASRFTLVFATGSSTGSETGNFAFFNNGVWIINNPSTGSGAEATLQVVDVLGHILSSETISGSCSKAINVAPGVYMLRLVNGDKVKVQKIVVR